HAEGTFGDVSYEAVVNKFSSYQDVYFHAGVIPATFTSRQSDRIAFAYLDVDQEQSTRDCLEFVWPRVVVGGIVVIDDYDWPWCPGIKPVVDSFFRERGGNISRAPQLSGRGSQAIVSHAGVCSPNRFPALRFGLDLCESGRHVGFAQ